MTSLTLIDVANRTMPVAEKRKRWVPKKSEEKKAEAEAPKNPARSKAVKAYVKSKSPLYSGRKKD